MSKKKKQRLLDLAKVAIDNRDKMIEQQRKEIMQLKDLLANSEAQERILRNICKEIVLVAESNTYNNDKLALRKLKELASTANQN